MGPNPSTSQSLRTGSSDANEGDAQPTEAIQTGSPGVSKSGGNDSQRQPACLLDEPRFELSEDRGNLTDHDVAPFVRPASEGSMHLEGTSFLPRDSPKRTLILRFGR